MLSGPAHTSWPLSWSLFRAVFCLSSSFYLPSAKRWRWKFSFSKCGRLSDHKTCCKTSKASVWKLLGTVISEQLRSFPKPEGLLKGQKHGFRQLRSTGDLLAALSRSFSATLDNGNETHYSRTAFRGLRASLIVWSAGDAAHVLASLSFHVIVLKFLSRRTISIRVDRVLSEYWRPRMLHTWIHPFCFLTHVCPVHPIQSALLPMMPA